MEQITLEQAANNATERLQKALAIKLDNNEDHDYLEGYKKGYVHGAQWQKEQDKSLKDAAERALDYLSIKYPKEAEILYDLKQAIEKYNNLS